MNNETCSIAAFYRTFFIAKQITNKQIPKPEIKVWKQNWLRYKKLLSGFML